MEGGRIKSLRLMGLSYHREGGIYRDHRLFRIWQVHAASHHRGSGLPTSGKVYLNGQDVYAQNNENLAIFRRRQVGLIYQFPQFDSDSECSGKHGLCRSLWIRGNKERLKDLLNLLGLEERKNHLPSLQEPAAAGRHRAALMNAPQVMLADEPTGNFGQPERT